jgi:hypothetical protein
MKGAAERMKYQETLRKSLAWIVMLCFTAVFFVSTVSAFADRNCCAVECLCTDCRCGEDCACKQECECPVILCSVCEAIVKQRESSERQIGIVSSVVTDTCPIPAITAAESDVLRICTASIIETHVRMNN